MTVGAFIKIRTQDNSNIAQNIWTKIAGFAVHSLIPAV
jgi:hypothetical protein